MMEPRLLLLSVPPLVLLGVPTPWMLVSSVSAVCATYDMHILDIYCSYSTELCSNGDIRLVGGMRKDSQNRSLEGRLEYCYEEQWGTVCDSNFDNFDARVICKEAGFSASEHAELLLNDPIAMYLCFRWCTCISWK